jgi:hypothetical protein
MNGALTMTGVIAIVVGGASMSRLGHGSGIGALMFPVYLVPVTIVAAFAAVIGVYCRFTACD